MSINRLTCYPNFCPDFIERDRSKASLRKQAPCCCQQLLSTFFFFKLTLGFGPTVVLCHCSTRQMRSPSLVCISVIDHKLKFLARPFRQENNATAVNTG